MFTNSLLRSLVQQLAVAVLMLALVGCSNDAPVAPLSTFSRTYVGPDDCPTCPQVSLNARIATIDQNLRRLTFAEHPDTVAALQNAEIVKFAAGVEVRIQLGDLRPDDSVTIIGQRYQNNYIYAHRIRVESSGPQCDYDLAFRDTIVTSDYQALSFTVAGRTETILVDQNTVIWGNIVHPGTQLGNGVQNQDREREQIKNSIDTVYQFTDLQVGDVVEVRAKVVDGATLLAVKIKLANCQVKQCVTFEAAIATLDVQARAITFVDLDWQGVVCPRAELTDSDGAELTLADFAAGDLVHVKGFPTESNLQICLMTKIEP